MSKSTPSRRQDRLITNEDTIRSILEKCHVMHIGLYDEDRIYMVPVNYSYTYENGKLSLYFHGACSGLKYDIISKRPAAGFSIDTGEHIISNETDPSHFTNYFESIIGSGTITILQTMEEKRTAMEGFMKHYSPKDWTITDRMLVHTAIYRLDVDEFQAHSNPGPKK